MLGTLLGFAAATVEGISPPTASAAPTEGASTTPLATPCRAVDTRNQPAGHIASATAPNPFGSRSFQIAGTNIAGQGGTTTSSSTPITVQSVAGGSPLTVTTRVAADVQFTCSTLANGQVVCWGRGESGQLGNGSFSDSGLPVVVSDIG